MKKAKTIIVNGKPFNLKAVASGMVQKPKTVHKPSANLVRLKNIIAKMLAKKAPKATLAAPAVKASEIIEAAGSSRLNFIRNWVANMAVNPSDLKAITQKELQGLTDAELNLLKRQIDAAQKQRLYDKVLMVK